MFTEKEETKASHNKNIRIENFNGVLGDLNNSCLEQTLNCPIKKNNFSELAHALKKCNIEEQDINQLKEAIDADGPVDATKKYGAKVADWIGQMATKSAKGTWNVS